MYITNSIKTKLAKPYKIPIGTSNIRFLSTLIYAWIQKGKILLGGFDPLTRLASKYETDKGKTIYPFHGYTVQYNRLFENFRRKELNILEIGLARTSYRGGIEYTCPSISLWLEYFPNAKVYGFDIDDFTFVKLNRAHLFEGDQGKPEDLLKMTEFCDNFDIIIDDGSHASYHQQITLKTLFPYLNSGGLYIIEDLHSQPEAIEKALACEHKTRELVKDRKLLDGLIAPVDSSLFFGAEFLGGEGEVGVIKKL